MNSPKRVIVIGAGITGLAAAWRLKQAFEKSQEPLNLLLLEPSGRMGGAIESVSREGFLLELGPDCFLSEKPRGIGLVWELGLERELIGTRPEDRRSFILRDGRFHEIPEGFYLLGPARLRPFLASPLLSWRGKFRALLEPLKPAHPKSDESLGAFVRRRFGPEMLDWLAQPLISGIYGADPEALSLRATFPQFLDMEREYGSVLLGLQKREKATKTASGARYSLFVTLRRGMQTLADELVKQLGTMVIRSNTRAVSITKSSFPAASGGESITAYGPPTGTLGGDDGHSTWQVRLANGEILVADAVCIALPSYAAAELLRTLDAELAADLAAIEYAPAATINFAFREMDIKRPLAGIGFVVPQKEKKLVRGCTFAHRKFEGRAPKGFVLARAFLGGAEGWWMHEKDETLMDNVFQELQGWLGITGKPMFRHLERYDRSLPQYKVGHLHRVLRIEERLLRFKGLALAGNWLRGVGIPDCIESGERAADQMTRAHRGAPLHT